MTPYFAYIRVSTLRQGTEGVSLSAQRSAITKYAHINQFSISAWFEETQTAGKSGRPTFNNMIRLLRKDGSKGIIIHKIDRGARNLRDWASLGELIDAGFDVRFAGDSLDLHTRGGRLAADIQAVVAADFVRNLREETLKGINGRLEQGLWPFRAPLGFEDNGPGKVKTVHPIQGPLVRNAFERYATGQYSLRDLVVRMNQDGLTNIEGRPVHTETLSKMLRNPFYMGRLCSGNRSYPGTHEQLVTDQLFGNVGEMLVARRRKRACSKRHLFSVTFRCSKCCRYIIAERHKGHMYYRCHTKGCLDHGFREEAIRRVLAGRMTTLGRDADVATIEGGDFHAIRDITAGLSGEIAFGEDHFTIDPLPRF